MALFQSRVSPDDMTGTTQVQHKQLMKEIH